jgi:hypothetical protein
MAGHKRHCRVPASGQDPLGTESGCHLGPPGVSCFRHLGAHGVGAFTRCRRRISDEDSCGRGLYRVTRDLHRPAVSHSDLALPPERGIEHVDILCNYGVIAKIPQRPNAL